MLKLNENIIKSGGNALFFLLILVIMLDPTNSVLHLKDIVFVLTVGYNIVFFKPDWRFLPHIAVIYAVIFLCYVFSEMQMNVIDDDALLGTFKGYAPLFLLLWVKYYDIIKLMRWPAFITSLVVVILYIVASSSEILEYLIFTYVKSHGETIMMTRRSFLGVKVFGMYYKSVVSLVFALYTVFYRMYNVKKGRWYMIPLALFMMFPFLVSGTRSTILLPFFLMGLVAYRTIAKMRKAKYIYYPLLVLAGIVFIMLIITLAAEKTEASNVIKYGHLTSYLELFENHPLYMIIGQGPGSIFYSIGFGHYTAITEWTYLELLRNYGIFCLFILFVIVKPLVPMMKNRDDNYTFGIAGAYFAYLLVAGTNPLLISSTGMIVILAVYAYVNRMRHK